MVTARHGLAKTTTPQPSTPARQDGSTSGQRAWGSNTFTALSEATPISGNRTSFVERRRLIRGRRQARQHADHLYQWRQRHGWVAYDRVEITGPNCLFLSIKRSHSNQAVWPVDLGLASYGNKASMTHSRVFILANRPSGFLQEQYRSSGQDSGQLPPFRPPRSKVPRPGVRHRTSPAVESRWDERLH